MPTIDLERSASHTAQPGLLSTSRRTKIVCTLGPATATGDRIRELVESGMDVARL
ncbi:pyruvate kinase, partial [Rhodococcus koreensis]